jgi:hypothetical protein
MWNYGNQKIQVKSAASSKQASYMLHVSDPKFHFQYAYAQHIQPILANSS